MWTAVVKSSTIFAAVASSVLGLAVMIGPLSGGSATVDAFSLVATATRSWSSLMIPKHQDERLYSSSTTSVLRMATTRNTQESAGDEFATFAASLEDDAKREETKATGSSMSSSRSSSSSNGQQKERTSRSSSWQADLERLLDPTTPAAQRQIVLSDLMNANEDIRDSVVSALRDRRVRVCDAACVRCFAFFVDSCVRLLACLLQLAFDDYVNFLFAKQSFSV
jgi:hypothetical protein